MGGARLWTGLLFAQRLPRDHVLCGAVPAAGVVAVAALLASVAAVAQPAAAVAQPAVAEPAAAVAH